MMVTVLFLKTSQCFHIDDDEEEEDKDEDDDNESSSLAFLIKEKVGRSLGKHAIYLERNRWLKLIRS